jgi:hypothetical protein
MLSLGCWEDAMVVASMGKRLVDAKTHLVLAAEPQRVSTLEK